MSIVDEWCCGYVKGIALDPSGWQPLFEAHPDWFEAIHLYGTESGWDRLNELGGLPGCRCETSGVRRIDSASRSQRPCVLACPPCTCERHHRRYATTDSQGARSRPQRPMPLWLWQEVQAVPWSTEIVALTCGTQNCDPCRPYSSVHGKLVVQHRSEIKNVGTLPPLSSLNLLTIRPRWEIRGRAGQRDLGWSGQSSSLGPHWSVPVPNQFELAFSLSDNRRRCDVVWRRNKVLGVKFT